MIAKSISAATSHAGHRVGTLLAWGLILAVWVATPFIEDQAPPFVNWAYAALTVIAFGVGMRQGIRQRKWALTIASVVTLLAWPIMVYTLLSLFGF